MKGYKLEVYLSRKSVSFAFSEIVVFIFPSKAWAKKKIAELKENKFAQLKELFPNWSEFEKVHYPIREIPEYRTTVTCGGGAS